MSNNINNSVNIDKKNAIFDIKINSFDKKLFSDNINKGEMVTGEWLSILKDGMKKADHRIKQAEDISLKSLNGEADLYEVMTSIAMAETDLKIAVQIKDSLLSAWQELMRLQF